MATQNLTAERLRELFHYNPQTGIFTRRVKTTIKTKIGEIAGCKMKRGGWSICIDYIRHHAHRLAWLYMTGNHPIDEIDHIDGNPLNNRFDNLRQANSTQNKQNQRRPRKDNRCGALGVHLHGYTKAGTPIWRARIQVNGKSVHVGCFSSVDDAHSAYLAAKRRLHEFCTV